MGVDVGDQSARHQRRQHEPRGRGQGEPAALEQHDGDVAGHEGKEEPHELMAHDPLVVGDLAIECHHDQQNETDGREHAQQPDEAVEINFALVSIRAGVHDLGLRRRGGGHGRGVVVFHAGRKVREHQNERGYPQVLVEPVHPIEAAECSLRASRTGREQHCDRHAQRGERSEVVRDRLGGADGRAGRIRPVDHREQPEEHQCDDDADANDHSLFLAFGGERELETDRDPGALRRAVRSGTGSRRRHWRDCPGRRWGCRRLRWTTTRRPLPATARGAPLTGT